MDRRRLFVAVWPPEEVVAALAGMERPERKGLRWTTADQWHVTLRFLGSLYADEERALIAALDQTDWAAIGPATVTAEPSPKAISRAVWALEVDGLDEVATAVASAASAAATEPRPADRTRRFRGHLTLARAKTPPALRGLPQPSLHLTWVAREVTLVRSTLAPTGATYDTVERWQLGGTGD